MASIEELIRSGAATLAFDTNAIISKARGRTKFAAFWNLCDDAEILRSHDVMPLPVRFVVPALAHMEVLHDLRVAQTSRPFDRALVEQQMKNKRVRVKPLLPSSALRASEVLHRWFPSDDAWQAAKRKRCLEALGTRPEHAAGHGLATIDWAIAAQAEAEGWILVTDDARAEFAQVSRKIAKGPLRALMDTLLAERGIPR